MSKEYPFVLFSTNQRCHHCIDFRGSDGIPNSSRKWNNNYIKSIFFGSQIQNPTKSDVKILRIIEIHDTRGYGNNLSYIGEINFYFTMPINKEINDNFFYECMSDDCIIFGDAILRISLQCDIDNKIKVIVSINNSFDDRRCLKIQKLVEKFFIWDLIPDNVFLLKLYFEGTVNNININNLMTSLRNYDLYSDINSNFFRYKSNPTLFCDLLLNKYNFDWLISKFFPRELRRVERYYPTWMLILPSEWKRSRDSNDKIYVKCLNCKTILEGTTYKTIDSTPETITDIISMYWRNKLFLTYDEELLK